MTVTTVLLVLVVVLATISIAAVAVGADRGARATAWRDIADERRWNQEQQHRT